MNIEALKIIKELQNLLRNEQSLYDALKQLKIAIEQDSRECTENVICLLTEFRQNISQISVGDAMEVIAQITEEYLSLPLIVRVHAPLKRIQLKSPVQSMLTSAVSDSLSSSTQPDNLQRAYELIAKQQKQLDFTSTYFEQQLQNLRIEFRSEQEMQMQLLSSTSKQPKSNNDRALIILLSSNYKLKQSLFHSQIQRLNSVKRIQESENEVQKQTKELRIYAQELKELVQKVKTKLQNDEKEEEELLTQNILNEQNILDAEKMKKEEIIQLQKEEEQENRYNQITEQIKYILENMKEQEQKQQELKQQEEEQIKQEQNALKLKQEEEQIKRNEITAEIKQIREWIEKQNYWNNNMQTQLDTLTKIINETKESQMNNINEQTFQINSEIETLQKANKKINNNGKILQEWIEEIQKEIKQLKKTKETTQESPLEQNTQKEQIDSLTNISKQNQNELQSIIAKIDQITTQINEQNNNQQTIQAKLEQNVSETKSQPVKHNEYDIKITEIEKQVNSINEQLQIVKIMLNGHTDQIQQLCKTVELLDDKIE
ncbi:Hypothetical_protein [Hexamita inflata]|uniref:Hypothetical_protein n=1 Tax=Hexamita inflata TaxID=28002 RepID=A0AA86N3S4_9EUKA|nr:Hypothetical protein HINF_LOCUS57 [Hexamita inflata]